MKQTIEHLVTPADVTHSGLAILAVINGAWTDYFGPFAQIIVTIGGMVYLYYMIRAKRMEWLSNKRKFDEGN